MSLSRRLALIVAAAVAVGIALASSATYVSSRGTLNAQVDSTLESQAGVLDNSPPLENCDNCSALLGLAPDLQVLTTGPFRLKLANRPVLPVTAADVSVAEGRRSSVLRDITVAGTSYRMLTVPYPPYGNGAAIEIAAPLTQVDRSLHRLAVALVLVTLAGVAVAIALGLVVARAGLAPIGALTEAVERVARTDELGPPLPESPDGVPPDEVSRLSSSFNRMLRALSASRARQRQLVADASHELRTPLTSLRTNVELLARAEAQGRPLAAEDRARLLSDVTAQTEEMASLIGELTSLARDDSPAEESEDLDLAEVAAVAVERVRRRAGEVRILAELTPTPITGRRGALERAVLNLLDNAVKWSPPAGEVFVGLRDRVLVVADHGPGIPAEDLPHVFDRFYRSPTARGLPGSGLGLSIVAEAAREHGGTVSLDRGPDGGTVARLWLPVVAGTTDEAEGSPPS
jgi:two-component system sensor histidine kinase MprB